MLTAALAAVFVLAVLWFGQRSLIYFPGADVPSPAAVGLPSAEVVSFETEDGLTLESWFVRPVPPALGYTVLVFGGNAGHRGDRAELAAQLAARGLAVWLIDYRGYGGNPGLPSERGLRRDARAALAAAGRRGDVDAARLVFFGESLGAAVALGLALDYAPAALVLRSPFTSLAAIGQRHYPFLPVRWLLRDRFRCRPLIGRIRSPLLVVAGELDRIVPVDDSRELFDEAPEPKRWLVVPEADHNDAVLVCGPLVVRGLLDLLGG